MSMVNQQFARDLALEKITITDKKLNHKPDHIQAQILELAYDYAAYQEAVAQKKRPGSHSKKNNKSPTPRPLLYQLLSAHSLLKIKSQQPTIEQPKHRPDQGHHAHRISIRYGYEASEQFLQTDFRWAYHDFFDPSSGLIEGAQLGMF